MRKAKRVGCISKGTKRALASCLFETDLLFLYIYFICCLSGPFFFPIAWQGKTLCCANRDRDQRAVRELTASNHASTLRLCTLRHSSHAIDELLSIFSHTPIFPLYALLCFRSEPSIQDYDAESQVRMASEV